jgi:hypothetical protein
MSILGNRETAANSRRSHPVSRLVCIACTAAALALPSVSAAQTAVTTPTAAAQASQPDWLTVGGDLRLRNEYFNNGVTLAPTSLHEQDYFRVRGRFWGTARATSDLTFAARIAAEPRYWEQPSFAGACKARTNLEERFALIDGLYAKWANAFGQPLTLTVGRQDIQLADAPDSWLVVDGTPGDGSWSLYFDSLRLTGESASLKTKFDLVLISQNALPDAWLPTLGRAESYPTSDQDERGAILYVTNKSIPNTQVDGYLMYKHDSRRTFRIAGVQKTPGDDADIATTGARVSGALPANWTYAVEAALQFGTKNDRIAGVTERRDIRAYGGRAKLTHAFKDPLSSQVTFTGELLSGDDPSTKGTDEMFDVLWGRWPGWSELYIYSYINETNGRIAQLNNLCRLSAKWAFVPVKGTNCSLTYQALYALETSPTRAVSPALFSYDGRFRGHHLQAWVKHQFTKNLSGHLWYEGMWQGGYYAQREYMSFARAELAFAF